MIFYVSLTCTPYKSSITCVDEPLPLRSEMNLLKSIALVIFLGSLTACGGGDIEAAGTQSDTTRKSELVARGFTDPVVASTGWLDGTSYHVSVGECRIRVYLHDGGSWYYNNQKVGTAQELQSDGLLNECPPPPNVDE